MANFKSITFTSDDKADEAVAREIVAAIKASDEHTVGAAEFHCGGIATDVCCEPPAKPTVTPGEPEGGWPDEGAPADEGELYTPEPV